MVYGTALAAPKRFQFETSSLHSQPENCGPTCITQIAGFYRDTWYGIEATRKLIAGSGPYNVNGQVVYGAPQGTATSAWQQAEMLRRRGVACAVRQIDSLAQLRTLLAGGRRPVLIGIQMSRVPPVFRDHPFTGWHAVLVLAVASGGFWLTDPNFSPPGGHRTDPDRGQKFYPDWVMQSAFINNSPRYSVVPTSPKAIATTPAPAPTPPSPPTSTAIHTAQGAPMPPVRFRDEDRNARLKGGKPIRSGASVNAPTLTRVPSAGMSVRIVGRMKNTGSYDPWFIYKWYISSGYQFVYSPGIDFE